MYSILFGYIFYSKDEREGKEAFEISLYNLRVTT